MESLVDISLTVSPIIDANDKIIGASKIARDISDRKRAEQTLREQAEIIETVNRLGQTLAAELDLHKLVQAVIDAATDISAARFGSLFYNVLNEKVESHMRCAFSGPYSEVLAQFPMPRTMDIFAPGFKREGTVLTRGCEEGSALRQELPLLPNAGRPPSCNELFGRTYYFSLR